MRKLLDDLGYKYQENGTRYTIIGMGVKFDDNCNGVSLIIDSHVDSSDAIWINNILAKMYRRNIVSHKYTLWFDSDNMAHCAAGDVLPYDVARYKDETIFFLQKRRVLEFEDLLEVL